jgi:hypothetical protein
MKISRNSPLGPLSKSLWLSITITKSRGEKQGIGCQPRATGAFASFGKCRQLRLLPGRTRTCSTIATTPNPWRVLREDAGSHRGIEIAVRSKILIISTELRTSTNESIATETRCRERTGDSRKRIYRNALRSATQTQLSQCPAPRLSTAAVSGGGVRRLNARVMA